MLRYSWRAGRSRVEYESHEEGVPEFAVPASPLSAEATLNDEAVPPVKPECPFVVRPHRQRDLVDGVVSGPVDAGPQEARPDTPAPVAVTHHHPEISDTARKIGPEVPNENAIGLRDECGCLLEVEAGLKNSAGPVTVDRRLRSNPTTLGRDLGEQGEPLLEVALDGASRP